MKKITLIMALIIGLSFSFSISAFADDSVIYGCYKKKNGKVRLVDGPDDCKKAEVSISWNVMGQGDEGKIGPRGPAGPKGDKGDQGVPGPAGAKGDKGDQGVPGPAGAKGDKGDQGNDGYDGADILNELCELYDLTGHEPPEKCFNCGDGEVQPGEECDDGNSVDDDGCSNYCSQRMVGCKVESYGDSFRLSLNIDCLSHIVIGDVVDPDATVYLCEPGMTGYITMTDCDPANSVGFNMLYMGYGIDFSWFDIR